MVGAPVGKPKKKKPSWMTRASSFFRQYKEVLWAGMLVVLVLALIAVAVLTTVRRVAPNSLADNITEAIGPSAPRHPLTGEVLDAELDHLPWVFGVMVENSAEAWPLAGLNEAFLVIEAPVEANIPRFIVFTSSEDDVEKLGPVRSARPYYLDWNDEFGAVYAHVGGSPEALSLIRNTYNTIDLNEFWQGEYFYRENGTRYAPHNVYTNSTRLVDAIDELQPETPSYESWNFTDGSSKGRASISVNWTDGVAYDVDWRYDNKTNQYTRYQGLSVMKLDDRSTVEADNIVVMATDIRVIDGEGRKSIETLGEGDAMIAQNGEVFLARWKKTTRRDRLRFYTNDGYEITMNAGMTWVEVVDSLSKVSIY